MTKKQTALVGIGANKMFCGRAAALNVPLAGGALGTLGALSLSALYDSPAWPDPSAPPYVNAVAAVRTALSPEAFLAALQAIEAGFGRTRDPHDRYGARSMDLDLLAMGRERRETDALTLPHPRLAERDFVLLPLGEVMPDFVHPVTGEGVKAMVAALPAVTARRLS